MMDGTETAAGYTFDKITMNHLQYLYKDIEIEPRISTIGEKE